MEQRINFYFFSSKTKHTSCIFLPFNKSDVKCISCFLPFFPDVFSYFYNLFLHHRKEFISCFIIISIIRKHVRCDALCSWRCPQYFSINSKHQDASVLRGKYRFYRAKEVLISSVYLLIIGEHLRPR